MASLAYTYYPDPATGDTAPYRAAMLVGPNTLRILTETSDRDYTVGPAAVAGVWTRFPALVPTFAAVPGPGNAVPVDASSEFIVLGASDGDFPFDPITVPDGERVNVGGLQVLAKSAGWSLDGDGAVATANTPAFGVYLVDASVSLFSDAADTVVTLSIWNGTGLATVTAPKRIARAPIKSTTITDPAGGAPHSVAIIDVGSNELVLRLEHNGNNPSDITIEHIFFSARRLSALPVE